MLYFLFGIFFVRHNVLLITKKGRKSSNNKGRHTHGEENEHEKYGIFQHPENTFILLFVDYFISSSLDYFVDEISNSTEERHCREYIAN